MLEASSICKDLYKWIGDNNRKGHVHSIFRNSINILGEDNRLISVVSFKKPISPNGIKIKNDIVFDDVGVNIGEKGIFSSTSFKSRNLNIFYRNANLWDKGINTYYERDSIDNIYNKFEILKRHIVRYGNKKGILLLLSGIRDTFSFGNPFYDKSIVPGSGELFIKDRFINFINDYEASNIEGINLQSKKIIGYGIGLTPSMDDFLSGLMISNIYLSDYLGKGIYGALNQNESIIKNMENKTTFVSKETLKFAAKGETNEDIKCLVTNLLGISEIEEFHSSIGKVMEIGESSGTDILCGIYIGSLIILCKFRGEGYGSS